MPPDNIPLPEPKLNHIYIVIWHKMATLSLTAGCIMQALLEKQQNDMINVWFNRYHYSIRHNTSYHPILWSLEAARSDHLTFDMCLRAWSTTVRVRFHWLTDWDWLRLLRGRDHLGIYWMYLSHAFHVCQGFFLLNLLLEYGWVIALHNFMWMLFISMANVQCWFRWFVVKKAPGV